MIDCLTYDNLTKQRDVAAMTISRSFNLYEAVTEYAGVFKYSDLHPSFINNLKDAVIHFQKLDEAYSKTNAVNVGDPNLQAFLQFELLSEHMTRALVDIYVEMLQNAALFYETFIDCMDWESKRGSITKIDDFIHIIRKAMHFCKTNVLQLRSDKIELLRVAKNHPAELNGGFVARLNIIRTTVKLHYQEMQKHLHDKVICKVYDFIMTAREKGYSLHRVKNNDSLSSIAKELSCTTDHLRTLNNLTLADNATIPRGITWLLY